MYTWQSTVQTFTVVLCISWLLSLSIDKIIKCLPLWCYMLCIGKCVNLVEVTKPDIWWNHSKRCIHCSQLFSWVHEKGSGGMILKAAILNVCTSDAIIAMLCIKPPVTHMHKSSHWHTHMHLSYNTTNILTSYCYYYRCYQQTLIIN